VPGTQPVYRLITTILDAQAAPAHELATLYHDTVSKVLFHKHLELSPYFRADGVLLEFKPATA
jgi:hypothetical protein